MKKTHKIVFAALLLPLLLAACQIVPPASPTPQGPTMPPAQTDGGLLPDGDDPIDKWRERRLFKDTEVVIPEKAFNYPVLIVENLEIDREVLEEFALSRAPEGVEMTLKDIRYFKDSQYPNKESYADRSIWYSLESGIYETQFGEELLQISQSTLGARYSFRKLFIRLSNLEPFYADSETLPNARATPDPDMPGQGSPIRYSEQEAVEIVRSALKELGVPAEELEVQAVWAYDSRPTSDRMHDMYREYYMPYEHESYPEDAHLPYGGRGYTIRLRHVFYDIPMSGGHYQIRDPDDMREIADFDYIGFNVDIVHAIVTDLGLRMLDISFHRVVEVEAYDVPIIPISDIIETNRSTILEMNRVDRISLALVPTYCSEEFEQTRFRLVPAWVFTRTSEGDVNGVLPHLVIIDAQHGKPIVPVDDFWRRWPTYPR